MATSGPSARAAASGGILAALPPRRKLSRSGTSAVGNGSGGNASGQSVRGSGGDGGASGGGGGGAHKSAPVAPHSKIPEHLKAPWYFPEFTRVHCDKVMARAVPGDYIARNSSQV